MRFTFLVAAVLLSSAASWKMSSFRPKHAAAAFFVASTMQGGPACAANDAFSGAMQAMSSQTRRQQEASSAARSFDELSAGAKKRFALERCKDSSARKEGGYKSASECTSDVLGGNYATIVSGREEEVPLKYGSPSAPSFAPISTPAPSPSPSPAPAQAPAAVSTPSRTTPTPALKPATRTAPSPSGPAAPAKQRKKSQDLSGLSSAAQRRRALAGCKKADARKAAGYRSENSCTERVLKEGVDAMIEALEYL